MGFTPAQVDEMSLWEFSCCRSAYSAHHGGETQKRGDIEEDRLRELGIEGF
ncbi:MAG: hypothetical protein ACPGSI_17155 [Pikeienuella sp.]